MDNLQPRPWTQAGSAPLACIHCRRLKMRCIGADNPPCVRCNKAGRECIIQPSRRGLQKPAASSTANTDKPRGRKQAKPSRSNAPRLDLSDQRIPDVPIYSPQERPAPSEQQAQGSPYGSTPLSSSNDSSHGTQSGLSAVYSTTMLSALRSPGQISVAANETSLSNSQTPHLQNGRSSRLAHSESVTDSTLQDLVRFFAKKLIYFVPILDHTDLDDINNVVRHKRPLAFCASLVASIYVPGGANVQSMLIPHVVDFLEELEGPVEQDEEVVWMQLQAYAILYAYRPSTDISNPSLDKDSDRRLNHWRTKSAIEDFAMRLGLHRALDQVKAQVREGRDRISEGFAFRKATYWLWLFTMSHHFALVTETPPTIRQDNSIKMACSLLSNVSKPPRVTRMLAEVDLCMLWNLADQSLPGLANWWCDPPDDLDIEEANRVLDDADAALDVWGRRWGLHGETDATYPGLDLNQNGAVDYHFRATRFWLRTFATRIVHHQLKWASNPALNISLTLKSAEAAEACCRFLLDIPPLMRDSARYMSDFGWALLAFCGIYVIRIYELFGRSFPVLEQYMTTVESCANLLKEMAVGSNQIPLIYGNRVLERLNAVVQSNPVENDIEHRVEDCRVDLQWVDDVFQQANALTG